MKKSFFGFSAKVAMAVLAVCSFVLTSCYEKAEPMAQNDPVYWVVGTVYDATTSETLAAAVTVGSTNVTGPSFAVKVQGSTTAVTTVNISAKMEGYKDVSRVINLVPASFNQISITSADIAMVPVAEPEPEIVAEMVDVTKNYNAEKVAADFGFPTNTEVVDGIVYVCDFFQVDAENAHNAHTASSSNQYCTTEPYKVQYPVYSGFVSADADQMMDIATSTIQTVYVGKEYADFAKNATTKEETLNEEGNHLLGWWLDKAFRVYEISYSVMGMTFKCHCVKAEGSVVTPMFDTHNTHNSHDYRTGHEHVNAGGGAADAE